MDKIDKLIELEGFSSQEELANKYISDSLCPAICINDGCSYTVHLEPDQDKGYCEECGTNSVKSLFILMGVI